MILTGGDPATSEDSRIDAPQMSVDLQTAAVRLNSDVMGTIRAGLAGERNGAPFGGE